jgi:AraC-like DNA-binding protein
MQYHEFPVKPELSEYIQTIWAMESENDEDAYPRSLIMPDGIVEVVFYYHSPFFIWQDGVREVHPEHAAVSMMRKYLEIESNGQTGFIAVRFYPWGAYHFFNKPVSSFLETTIDGVKLWGDDSRKIILELKHLVSLDQRLQSVELFLLSMLSKFQKVNREIDEAVKLIRNTKGMLSVDDVCNKTGFSKKQLERKFLPVVGTTPKIFSRVCRFLNICHHLDEQKEKSLTQLAYECGYYDQAHFINEFKEFSGFTPKDFFAKENIWFTQV